MTGNDGDRLVALDDGAGRGIVIDRLVTRIFGAFRVGANRIGELVWQAGQSATLAVRQLEPVDEYNGGQQASRENV